MATTEPKSAYSLAKRFIRTARSNWKKRCISDSTGKHLAYGGTLVSAIALSDELKKITHDQKNIGILLPPSVGAALTNLAVTLLGKVSVNLNYVAPEQLINSAISQCNIKTIISSTSFFERIKHVGGLHRIVFLEDITTKLSLWKKIKAYFKARFLPLRKLTENRPCGDDLATIIFSSGSSGEPKGVMLSYRNILSNIDALTDVFILKPNDNLCSVLPLFHSFGFSCSLWLPIVKGVSTSFVANPLDGKSVGQTARSNQSTVLFAAPTFLSNYIRRVEHDEFANLRVVVVGAEKLKKQLADSFNDKFGIRPLEGYGATELSPVVSLNLPDEQSCDVDEVLNKEGTVGRPLPGVEVKIVETWSRKPAQTGQSGLLMVKGPTVMLGYLNKEAETAEAIKDGWFNTGDIANIDEDGFLTITDRLARFSKIGGEMIPHSGVEEVYLQSLDMDEQVVVVTSIPEEKKGEELIVLYLEKAGSVDKLHEIISKSNLPNMWKPRKENYIRIESMPTLGSGKLNVMKLREIALDRKRANEASAVSSEVDHT